jgi:glycosyltransferase involved in cell wall biosynthesis
MKLSILVCSTQNRYNTFLPKILKQLFDQCDALPLHLLCEVEVITVIDNKCRMLGTKRNDLLNMAQGEYVVFVDDDDRVADDYVEQLVNAAFIGADIIVFQVSVSINGEASKICYYSNMYSEDYNQTVDKIVIAYHRLPNHIMAVKKNLALKVKYKDILKGEDAEYSKRLLSLLESQYSIDKVLYYDYSDLTTETQQKLKKK